MRRASSTRPHASALRAVMLLAGGFETLARAEDDSVTDAQLLYGGPFDDIGYGNNTASRQLLTLTLEHFGVWSYGDNYFYIDFLFGDFVDAEGQRLGDARVYSEWVPRLSIGKTLDRDVGFAGIFSDVFVAAQVEAASNAYWAALGGAGVNIDVPSPYVIGVNAYVRKDAFNDVTFQVTAFWEVPFALRTWQFRFRGYVDVFGTDHDGVDINSQPQLLLDLGSVTGRSLDRLQVGIENYFHRNDRLVVDAPQAMVRWLW